MFGISTNKVISMILRKGAIFVMVGLTISYPSYEMLKKDSIFERVLLAEIVFGMILACLFIVNLIFEYTDSLFSKYSFTMAVIWIIITGITITIGIIIKTNMNPEMKAQNGEIISNIKRGREQLGLELVDNIEEETNRIDEGKSWHCISEDKYWSNGIVAELIDYQYDDDGTLNRKVFYDGEGKIEKYKDYIYNKRGNLVKVEVYEPRDDTGSKQRYEYYEFDMDNVIYDYDDKGICISKKALGNIMPDYETYTYDSEGKLVKVEEFAHGETYCVNEYIYDKNDQLEKVRRTHMEDGAVKYIDEDKYSYEYDDGKIAKQIVSGTYKYITYYDNEGNVIKEEKWEGSELYYYTEFSYEYF